MTSGPNQVIVTTEDFALHSVHGLSVHHRDFPEVHCEGISPESAAALLSERLSASLDSAPSYWRRKNLERAIEDVRAFEKRARA